MKQIEIKELLREAANPECPLRRIHEILDMLAMSITMSCTETVAGEAGRIMIHTLLVRNLFEQAEKNRSLFPLLFVTIAAICGDREKGNLLAMIDVSIADTGSSTKVGVNPTGRRKRPE